MQLVRTAKLEKIVTGSLREWSVTAAFTKYSHLTEVWWDWHAAPYLAIDTCHWVCNTVYSLLVGYLIVYLLYLYDLHYWVKSFNPSPFTKPNLSKSNYGIIMYYVGSCINRVEYSEVWSIYDDNLFCSLFTSRYRQCRYYYSDSVFDGNKVHLY